MTPKFYLKDAKSKKETLIFFVFNVFGYRAKKSTGIKIHPIYWNFKYYRVKPSHPDSIIINKFLDKLETKGKQIRLEYISEMIVPGCQEFLEKIFEIKEPDYNILDKFDQFIESKSNRLSEMSLKPYNSVKANLVLFNPNISDLKQNTIDRFIDFLLGKKYSPNYINKQISILGLFCKFLNIPFNPKNKVQKKKTDSIALTLSEINKIITCEKLNPDMQRIRDVFVFACYTGLRYSDIRLFNPSYIQELNNIKCLVFYAKKTGNKSVIPIFSEVQKILDRNNGTLPKRVTSQKFNIALKEVCRLSGITENIQVAKLKGLDKIIEIKPKYEAISSHCGRRTFVTIMSVLGLTSKEISLMSGHTQQSVVDIYDKSKADSNATKVFENLKGKI